MTPLTQPLRIKKEFLPRNVVIALDAFVDKLARQCEGTGWVPIDKDDTREPWRLLWLEAEMRSPSDDGWHFVKCPDCDGTGKRTGGE